MPWISFSKSQPALDRACGSWGRQPGIRLGGWFLGSPAWYQSGRALILLSLSPELSLLSYKKHGAGCPNRCCSTAIPDRFEKTLETSLHDNPSPRWIGPYFILPIIQKPHLDQPKEPTKTRPDFGTIIHFGASCTATPDAIVGKRNSTDNSWTGIVTRSAR